jgi:hypothetical protein
MNLFTYKLTLAPALVALATLAGRRWGPLAAGLVVGLPIVAGPILFFNAADQGAVFATEEALFTLLGIISLCAFSLAYAWRAWSGGTAVSSLALGWAAFAASTILIQGIWERHSLTLLRALCYALAALFLSLRSLPPAGPPAMALPGEGAPPQPKARKPGAGDLPLRMLSAALLVWLLTTFAERLGPRLGGLLTPFPVASTVVAVFAHRDGASEAVRAVLKGLLLALNAFAAFCGVLAATLGRMGLLPAFGAALAAAVLVQVAIIALQRSRRAPPPAAAAHAGRLPNP